VRREAKTEKKLHGKRRVGTISRGQELTRILPTISRPQGLEKEYPPPRLPRILLYPGGGVCKKGRGPAGFPGGTGAWENSQRLPWGRWLKRFLEKPHPEE